MITPHIVDDHNNIINNAEKARAIQIENELEKRANEINIKTDKSFKDDTSIDELNETAANEVEVNQTTSNQIFSSNCNSQHPANLSSYGC